MTTVILRTTARVVVPLIVLLSIALFVQGHNLPGGGFIGGVLTATAFALIYVAYDLAFLEETVLERPVRDVVSHLETGIVVDYRRLFAVGLLIAVVSGVAPILLLGDPFLSQYYRIFEHVPLYHEVEVATAVAFDFGVYCVVVGALLTVLSVVGAE